ncbi:MAG: hypothetical protein RL015_2876 [Verrucomicrobiota bacterium]|jgi:lysophospholipase L1-like esterase
MNIRPVLFSLLIASALQADQCLVIGDSLTKEYEIEFPILFPRNREAWDSRNWAEILHRHRNGRFDLGKWGAYLDPRIAGHRHNWAFPGIKTSEIKKELDDWKNGWWTRELQKQIRSSAERVVIFAGGNDVDDYYAAIYQGAPAGRYINATRDNLKWVVDYVRKVRGTIPIVLVSVPHVGCTPDIQRSYPTDAVKTQRVTAALDSLNAQLALFAKQRGIGFAPEVYQLTKTLITEPLQIGDVTFISRGDDDARPEFLFSGDGFHPNTAAHAKIAQFIIEAFRRRYTRTSFTALTDAEILQNVLGF